MVRWKETPVEHKSWLAWVSSSILAVSRLTEMHVRNYYVWDKLIRQRPIDLGKQIEWSLRRIATNPRINMGHTHLIRDLCQDAGVPIDPAELTVAPGRFLSITRRWCDLHNWVYTPQNLRANPIPKSSTAPPPKAKGKAIATTSTKRKATDDVPLAELGPRKRKIRATSSRASSSRSPKAPKQKCPRIAMLDDVPQPPPLVLPADQTSKAGFRTALMSKLDHIITRFDRMDKVVDAQSVKINEIVGVMNVEGPKSVQDFRFDKVRKQVKLFVNSFKSCEKMMDWASSTEEDDDDDDSELD